MLLVLLSVIAGHAFALALERHELWIRQSLRFAQAHSIKLLTHIETFGEEVSYDTQR